MSLFPFLFASAALLLTPGPTNMLVGIAGAEGGRARAARMIPAEMLGYWSAIVPLAWIGSSVLAQWPIGAILFKVGGALWIIMLALNLWRAPTEGVGRSAVTARRVYVTTLLNPKAAIFALVLLPPLTDPAFLPRMALLSLTMAIAALTWGLAGSTLRMGQGHQRQMRIARQLASAWLVVISVGLVAALRVSFA